MANRFLIPSVYLSRILSGRLLLSTPWCFAWGVLPILALIIGDCLTVAGCFGIRKRARERTLLMYRRRDSIDDPTHPGNRSEPVQSNDLWYGLLQLRGQRCFCFWALEQTICGLDLAFRFRPETQSRGPRLAECTQRCSSHLPVDLKPALSAAQDRRLCIQLRLQYDDCLSPSSSTLAWYARINLSSHVARSSPATRAKVAAARLQSQKSILTVTCMWHMFFHWMDIYDRSNITHRSPWLLILVEVYMLSLPIVVKAPALYCCNLWPMICLLVWVSLAIHRPGSILELGLYLVALVLGFLAPILTVARLCGSLPSCSRKGKFVQVSLKIQISRKGIHYAALA